jgi:hypothetical protein
LAATLKIDGFDFFTYLRVAPGEGFDPASPGAREPRFGETSIGDSQPLISVNERNKELAWPLHLNAASKDALHALLIDVNRRLTNAKLVEWKDDGATSSTFYDVLFARFDPDYNYRRAQVKWMSGVLRVWVKSYGTTGTYRIAGTCGAPSYGFPGVAEIASLPIGDLPAFIAATNVTDAAILASYAFSGFAAIPTKSYGFWSASVLNPNLSAGATRTQATSAIGSQTHRRLFSGSAVQQLAELYTGPSSALVGFSFPPEAVAPGRHHIVGIVRSQGTTAAASGFAVSAQPMIGGGSLAYGPTLVLPASCHWRPISFGIMSQPTRADIEYGVRFWTSNLGGSAGSATGAVDLCGVYLLPEDTSYIVGEANHQQLYTDEDTALKKNSNWTPVVGQLTQQPRLPVSSSYKMISYIHDTDSDQVVSIGTSVYAVKERFDYAR